MPPGVLTTIPQAAGDTHRRIAYPNLPPTNGAGQVPKVRQRSVPFEGAVEAGGDSESACGASSSNSQIGQPGKTKKQGQKRSAQ